MPLRKRRRRVSVPIVVDNVMSRFRSTFAMIEIAEVEIASAGNPDGAFLACVPTPVLQNAGLELYRVHVREMIERIETGADLEPGTTAEVLASMVETSLRAPLNSEGMAVYVWAFRRLFPDHESAQEPEREMWPGQVAEHVAAARRRLRHSRSAT